MSNLPVSVMEKLIKTAGAKRVSESAKEELNKVLKKRLTEISHEAIVFAKHAGRKTIKKEDISLAIESQA